MFDDAVRSAACRRVPLDRSSAWVLRLYSASNTSNPSSPTPTVSSARSVRARRSSLA